MSKPSTMREKIFAYAKFNLDALLSLASKLRGQPCTCDVSKRPVTGSLNWVIFLTFEDGIEWVFRSPRSGPDTILTGESASKMLISEASTLKYLRTRSSIPVPDVYSFSGSHGNDIGVPYILMSKASGRVLSEYDWIEISHRVPGYPIKDSLLPLTDQNREKIMSQLGAMMSRLAEAPRFDKIGSVLEDSNGSYSVGECLSPSLLWQWRDTLEGFGRGPFDTESQYFNALIAAFIAHAKELPLTPHCFFAPVPDPFEYPHWASYRAAIERWRTFCHVGDKIEGSRNRLDYCIAGHLLRDMVPFLASEKDAGFVLSHPDLHLGNVFVDEDFNITSIIDWSSASAGPMSELLATPGFSGSFAPPAESLVAAFRAGFRQAGPHIVPEQWEKADRIWHFSRLIRLLSTQDYTLFQRIYELVYANGSDDIPQLFHEQSVQEYGKKLLIELNEDELEDEDDTGEEKKDDSSSHAIEPVRFAMARKITLMSKMNPNFVADRRLWQWIEDAVGLTNFE